MREGEKRSEGEELSFGEMKGKNREACGLLAAFLEAFPFFFFFFKKFVCLFFSI